MEKNEVDYVEEKRKEYIKDALIAEYTSLRQEAIQRVSTQSTVIGWLIGITGTFIGLNIAITPSGMKYPIIVGLFFNPSGEVVTLFAFLCAGFVISVLILLLFWIYQLYHMLLISHYIKNKEKDMKEFLNIILDKNIFGWESNKPNDDKYPLKIAKYAQPSSLYIFSALGITGLVISSFISFINYKLIFSNVNILLAIILGLMPSLVAIILIKILHYLYKIHSSLEKFIKGV